jgi:hypothetical protein
MRGSSASYRALLLSRVRGRVSVGATLALSVRTRRLRSVRGSHYSVMPRLSYGYDCIARLFAISGFSRPKTRAALAQVLREK